MTALKYRLDGVLLNDYGVSVSQSDGILDRPKTKAITKTDWAEYHGEIVDLEARRFEPREINLTCFLPASSILDFVTKLNTFLQLFDATGTRRLSIEIDPDKPLVYEVYCEDSVAVKKNFNASKMIGTFSIKLKEPEPVKRVYKHVRLGDTTKTVSITLTSSKLVSIYWGDGTKTLDVSGTGVVVSHDYAINGTYFIIMAGVLEEITNLSTNATTVWNKL